MKFSIDPTIAIAFPHFTHADNKVEIKIYNLQIVIIKIHLIQKAKKCNDTLWQRDLPLVKLRKKVIIFPF